MSMLFDVTSGEVNIGCQLVLRGGSTTQELISAGLVFVREFDMKTGWVFRTTKPQFLDGHDTQLSLGFQDDNLRRMSFGFTENPALSGEDLFKKHNIFLRQELGLPTSQNDHQCLYQFGWGEIASEMDPRGGGSYIAVAWL